LFFEDQVHIADGAEFVRIVSAAVVDDSKSKRQVRVLVTVGPPLKVVDEFGVRNDVGVVDGVDRI
jgi:hypothetical protein